MPYLRRYVILLNVCDFSAAETFFLGGGGLSHVPLLLFILSGSTPITIYEHLLGQSKLLLMGSKQKLYAPSPFHNIWNLTLLSKGKK